MMGRLTHIVFVATLALFSCFFIAETASYGSVYSEIESGVIKGAKGGELNNYDDALRKTLGPARLSHADEYKSILKECDELGIKVDFQKGRLNYQPNPTPGKPGRLVLDPDASIGALRHEYKHVLDDIDSGWHGFRNMMDSNNFWRMEFRGYLEELKIAREMKDYKTVRSILKEMRDRRMEILGR